MDNPHVPINRVALITGGTSGIGKETAVKLAQDHYTVVIVGRDPRRGDLAVQDIRNRSKNAHVTFIQADMSLMRDVNNLASTFIAHHHRLDILIHSAGVIHTKRILTHEGLEATFATDYLSRFLLTELLLDLLQRSAPARVVNVAGTGAGMGKIHFEDLLGAREIGGMRGLGQAQFANDVWTVELARRYPNRGITFSVLHPGAVDTNIRREFPKIVNGILNTVFKPFAMTAEQGAEAPYFLATSAEAKAVNGGLFKRTQHIQPSAQTRDAQAGTQLWTVSQKLTQDILKEMKI